MDSTQALRLDSKCLYTLSLLLAQICVYIYLLAVCPYVYATGACVALTGQPRRIDSFLPPRKSSGMLAIFIYWAISSASFLTTRKFRVSERRIHEHAEKTGHGRETLMCFLCLLVCFCFCFGSLPVFCSCSQEKMAFTDAQASDCMYCNPLLWRSEVCLLRRVDKLKPKNTQRGIQTESEGWVDLWDNLAKALGLVFRFYHQLVGLVATVAEPRGWGWGLLLWGWKAWLWVRHATSLVCPYF